MENADIRDFFLRMREKKHRKYEEDVEIAVDELTKMKLYPIDGEIVLDLSLSGELLDTLLDITDNFPSVRYDSEGFTLDGCFQAIRIYKDDNISSEVSFSSGDELVLPKGKEHLANLLYNLYIEIGRLIE